MSTERITLTQTPVQITTGEETAYISSHGGTYCLIDSDTQPTDLSIGHAETKSTITPPFVIWAYSTSRTGTDVSISKRIN